MRDECAAWALMAEFGHDRGPGACNIVGKTDSRSWPAAEDAGVRRPWRRPALNAMSGIGHIGHIQTRRCWSWRGKSAPAHDERPCQPAAWTTIPGFGPILGTRRWRELAAAAPRHLPTAAGSSPPGLGWCRVRTEPEGRSKRGRISKRGDGYLRRLLVNGAHTRCCFVRKAMPGTDPWRAVFAQPASPESWSRQSPWRTRRRAWPGR